MTTTMPPVVPHTMEPGTATPEQTLAALRAAGLASGLDSDRFRDACRAEQRAQQTSGQAHEPAIAEAFDEATLLAALSTVYAAQGLTDTSAPAGILAIDERAEKDPEVRARVQALLVRWLGLAIPAPETVTVGRMLDYAADAVYLRQHTAGPGAAPMFAADGERATDGLTFTIYLVPADEEALSAVPIGFWPRVSPDTEAAASGIFRVDGCRPAFAEHAPACAVCQAQLANLARTNRLPRDFAALLVP